MDIHIIGEIRGCRGFRTANLFCSWELVAGPHWLLVEGDDRGQTHVIDNEDTTVWAHPIDVHFRTSSVQGWPRLVVHVWSLDGYGRRDICGYGSAFISFPSAGGLAGSGVQSSLLEIPTWQPSPPSVLQQFRAWLLGGRPVLRDDTLVADPDDRHKLHAISRGVVAASVYVISRGSAALAVHLPE
eukprot:TRINITY_DN12370_c0_g1_i1.p1 TRINITY_DN12370_c0_g1~~TRINITY_DN12370_c0_g1_i1.p1  ORF type:complete len:185 (-),score=20.61 TRINITY_DN12370_c0_g1_i1:221-775(-)